MLILVLGSQDFVQPLEELGHRVISGGPLPGTDIPLAPDEDWAQLSEILAHKGLEPDAILVCDHIGRRMLPTGLWRAQAVTVFYGLDAPLNRFWQMPYARLFDLAFLDQPREAEVLARSHPGAAWLPVAVDPKLYLAQEDPSPRAGVCFVGVVDPRLRPKRSAVLRRVERLAPLTVRGGRRDKWFDTSRAARLYRAHQVVLNENLFPGVTTRPLEVMAAGGCLLSEAAPGAMDQLFTDSEHLLFFGPEDIEQKLEFLLRNENLRRRLAQRGRDLVCQEHGLQQRAQEICRHIEEISALSPGRRPRVQGGEALRLEGEALLMAALRWPAQEGSRRILRAATRLEEAAGDGARALPAARAAGLAALVGGRPGPALFHLARAAEMGGERDRLVWGLAAFSCGQVEQGRQALQGLPGLGGEPGRASFHLGAAELLARAGCALGVGFNRRGLPPSLWTSLEHLLQAVALEPRMRPAWELMGDLLLAGGAPNQAWDAYQRAWELKGGEDLDEKMSRAAREGYL